MKEKPRQTSEVCFKSFLTFGIFQASITGHFIGLKIKTSTYLNACCMSITEGKSVIHLLL